MRRHTGATLLVLLLCAVGGAIAWRAITLDVYSAPTSADATRVAVEVAPIESGTLRDVRVLSGTLEASTRFDVAAKVGGLLERIAVDLGDEVRRGEVVAEIDDDEFVQAVAQADAELAVRKAEQAQATSELERVQRDHDRISSLRDRGAASDVELDAISSTLASQKAAQALAEARVRQAEAALELARIRLGYATVRASWQSGPDIATVGERFEDAGDMVQAGDTIVAVVALDPLTAVVSITERDYTRLRIGQAATLETDAVPARAFHAEIARIAPVFRETSRQARIELRVPNPDRVLKPGMFVRVRIMLREEAAATIVPFAAHCRRENRDVVFVLSEDAASVRLVPVTVGIVDGDRIQVSGDGLRGQVVVLGQQLLSDGSPVKVHSSVAGSSAESADE